MNRRATDALAAAIRRACEPELALLRACLLKQANPLLVVNVDAPLTPSPPDAPQDPRARKAAAQRKWREKKRDGRPPSKEFPPPVDPERLRKAREIYAAGGSNRDIRRETGLGMGTIIQYRQAEGWTRAEGATLPTKGRRRADPAEVVAEARRLYEAEWLGVKAIAQRLGLSSAGKVETWRLTDGWQRRPKPKAAEVPPPAPPPSEIMATSAPKPVDSVGVAVPVQSRPAGESADRPLPQPADPEPGRAAPPAFVSRAPALRRVADYLFDQLRADGIGQATAANRVARLSDEELLDQANHRRARRRLLLFAADGTLVPQPEDQAPATPVRHIAPRGTGVAPSVVFPRPRTSQPLADLPAEQEAILRAGWADPNKSHRDIANEIGLRQDQVALHARRLDLGAKAQRPSGATAHFQRASAPREAPPPDVTMLEPVPATLDAAQDWLIEDLVRADKVTQAEAEDRTVAMPAKRLVAEVNRRRIALGLSPYFLTERAA
jgi:hypothetical protein